MNRFTFLLWIIFAVILVIVLIMVTFFSENNRDATFPVEKVRIDTAKLYQIEILPKQDASKAIKIFKSENRWWIRPDGVDSIAVDKGIKRMMMQHLSSFRPDILLSTDPEEQVKYGINEGTMIKLYEKGDREISFIIGGHEFRRMHQTITAFKVPGDERVFAVELYLDATLNQTDIEEWVSKTLALIDIHEVSAIDFRFAKQQDYSIVKKQEGIWEIEVNGEKAGIADTLLLSDFLETFSPLQMENYLLSSALPPDPVPVAKLILHSKKGEKKQVEGFIIDDRHFLSSNAVRGGFFPVSEQEFLSLFLPAEFFKIRVN